jgi:hypothetical protein
MNPLILAATIGQLALPPEPVRAAVQTDCEICLLTYVHNPGWPDGREMIHEECGFTPATAAEMRARQLAIATQGNFSFLSLEDWGTWYGPHRIESVQAVLLPPCY